MRHFRAEAPSSAKCAEGQGRAPANRPVAIGPKIHLKETISAGYSFPLLGRAAATESGQHHINYNDSAHMVRIGTTLCHELRNSLPSDEALRRIQNFGYASNQAGVIAADAVISFCPDMNADAH